MEGQLSKATKESAPLFEGAIPPPALAFPARKREGGAKAGGLCVKQWVQANLLPSIYYKNNKGTATLLWQA